jgi:hypothetical protein
MGGGIRLLVSVGLWSGGARVSEGGSNRHWRRRKLTSRSSVPTIQKMLPRPGARSSSTHPSCCRSTCSRMRELLARHTFTVNPTRAGATSWRSPESVRLRTLPLCMPERGQRVSATTTNG